MALKQPFHDINIFGINIYRIDRTKRFVFCNIRAYDLEQWTILLAVARRIAEIIQQSVGYSLRPFIHGLFYNLSHSKERGYYETLLAIFIDIASDTRAQCLWNKSSR